MNRLRTAFLVSTVMSAALSLWFMYDTLCPPTHLNVEERLPEEILFYGYFSVWTFLAVPEFVFLFAAWKTARTRRETATAAMLGSLFAIVTVIGFFTYRTLMARVLGVPESEISVAKALFF